VVPHNGNFEKRVQVAEAAVHKSRQSMQREEDVLHELETHRGQQEADVRTCIALTEKIEYLKDNKEALEASIEHEKLLLSRIQVWGDLSARWEYVIGTSARYSFV
jgi:hypothetical protein